MKNWNGLDGRELLPLEQQHRLRHEQQHGRGDQVPLAVDQVGQPLAERPVADLVVVLAAVHERPARLVGDLRAAQLAGGRTLLALEEEALLDGRRDVFEAAGVVGVVGLALAGQVGAQRMVEVVGPDAVQPQSALLRRPDLLHQVAVVLGDDDGAAGQAGCGPPRRSRPAGGAAM